MQIISDPKQMQALSKSCGCDRNSIGFVPTMGALHEGHIELCRRARGENNKLIASIFVNPAQFGPNEDLARYPRTLQADLEKLEAVGCDIVFTPDAKGMYGDADLRHGTWIDVTPFDELWEGVVRPGHMRGVATVVAKLFNITLPDRAYFGEKDWQQLQVVTSLVRDLNFPIEIIGVPTVRESDGLALSSRNTYLKPEERTAATAISRAIKAGAEAARAGENDVAALGRIMTGILEQEPLLKPQYIAVVESHTLQPLQHLSGQSARIIAAVHVGNVRLIDNIGI